jgi:uncharacterized protein YtpQ (UPF0354 family)
MRYLDPQRRFEVAVPDGWSVESTERGAQVVHQRPPSGAITLSFFALGSDDADEVPVSLRFDDGKPVSPAPGTNGWTWTAASGVGALMVSYFTSDAVDGPEVRVARAIIESLRTRCGPPVVPHEFVERVRAAIGEAVGASVERDGDSLVVGPVHVHLDNIYALCADDPGVADDEIDRFAATVSDTLARIGRPIDLEAERDALWPVLYPARYVVEREMAHRPWVGLLAVAYAIDVGGALQYVLSPMAAQQGFTVDALHEIALANAVRLDAPPFAEDVPGVLRVEVVDSFTAARLILPDIGERARRTLACESILAAVPARDLLLFGRPDAEAVLREHARVAFHEAPHPLTDQLFHVTSAGVSPLATGKKPFWKRLFGG